MPHPQPAHNVLARHADHLGVEMDLYTPGVALAAARIAELHRQADRWRLARRLADRTRGRHRHWVPGSRRLPERPGQAADRAGGRAAGAAAAGGPRPATTEAAMLTAHQHKQEEFDPGHCPTCARQAGLLDHYDRVQREETRLRQTRAWARAARRYAIWALGSSGGGILLATAALLTR
jgi:hypothetical protein